MKGADVATYEGWDLYLGAFGGFPKWGYLSVGLNNEDYEIWGSRLRSPYLGNYQVVTCNNLWKHTDPPSKF